MGDLNWWSKERPKLECAAYSTGKYDPISFETKLEWIITINNQKERHFIASANLYSTQSGKVARLIVRTAYSFGRMRIATDGLPHYFEFNTETNDPEEAMYLAEQRLIDVSIGWREFYNSLANIIRTTKGGQNVNP